MIRIACSGKGTDGHGQRLIVIADDGATGSDCLAKKRFTGGSCSFGVIRRLHWASLQVLILCARHSSLFIVWGSMKYGVESQILIPAI